MRTPNPHARVNPETRSVLTLIEGEKPVDAVEPGALLRARIVALIMLGVVVATLGYIAICAYRVFADSFVAPLLLSPDSDLVVASKFKLDELRHERAKAAAELLEIDAELHADQDSLGQLRDLRNKLQREVDWMSDMNAHKTRVGMADLHTLGAQRRLGDTMVAEQQSLTRKAETDLKAGLITRMEYARELEHLRDLQRSQLDHRRDELQSRSNIHEISMNARGLRGASAGALGPQRLAREEQLTHLAVEIVQLESSTQGKEARRNAHLERFSQVDRLMRDLEARPLFRAIDRKIELAFVPYSQVDGVEANASVYECYWGILFCHRVGRVSEVIEGEVTQADPWGTPTRGLYAVLDLTDHEAARAKTLRVRSGSRQPAPVAPAHNAEYGPYIPPPYTPSSYTTTPYTPTPTPAR